MPQKLPGPFNYKITWLQSESNVKNFRSLTKEFPNSTIKIIMRFHNTIPSNSLLPTILFQRLATQQEILNLSIKWSFLALVLLRLICACKANTIQYWHNLCRRMQTLDSNANTYVIEMKRRGSSVDAVKKRRMTRTTTLWPMIASVMPNLCVPIYTMLRT